MSPVCILACSPRAGGNSDIMAHCFAAGVQEAGGQAHIHYLRDTPVAPCTACGACARTGRCVLPDSTLVEGLYRTLTAAPLVFVAAPIYFYHLPAQCKAFIDRAQYLWGARHNTADSNPLSLRVAPSTVPDSSASPTATASSSAASRRVCVGLVAGRAQGEQLFNGSVLTLRYGLALCGLTLADTLLLRGYDEAGALAADADATARCHALGLRAQREYVCPSPVL